MCWLKLQMSWGLVIPSSWRLSQHALSTRRGTPWSNTGLTDGKANTFAPTCHARSCQRKHTNCTQTDWRLPLAGRPDFSNLSDRITFHSMWCYSPASHGHQFSAIRCLLKVRTASFSYSAKLKASVSFRRSACCIVWQCLLKTPLWMLHTATGQACGGVKEGTIFVTFHVSNQVQHQRDFLKVSTVIGICTINCFKTAGVSATVVSALTRACLRMWSDNKSA